jgi:coronin-7
MIIRGFNRRSNSKEGDGTEDVFDDGIGKFDRSSNERCSIAERRRMYENRSASVQETATQGKIAATVAAAEAVQASPTLRRRDSLKSRRRPEPEEKRVSVVNPSTKRTSTVFGSSSFCLNVTM